MALFAYLTFEQFQTEVWADCPAVEAADRSAFVAGQPGPCEAYSWGYRAVSPDGVYEYDIQSDLWSFTYHNGDGTTGESMSLAVAKQIAGLQ